MDLRGGRLSTSCYGRPVPLCYGTVRLAPNIINLPLESPPSNTTGGIRRSLHYNTDWYRGYGYAAFLALCEGPIAGITGVFQSNRALEAHYCQTPTTWYSSGLPVASWIQIAEDSTSGIATATGYGGTTIWWRGNDDQELVNPVTAFEYRAGTAGQTAPGATHQTPNPPAMHTELGYSSTAYLILPANPTKDPKSPVPVPQYEFEVKGLLADDSLGGDAYADEVILDLFARAGWDTSTVDVTAYRNYCGAMGFTISLALTEQRPVLDIAKELLDATNAVAFPSDGKLKIVPLGDTPVTANGFTYTPVTTPVYTVGADDMIASEGASPVSIERASGTDAKNAWPIEYTEALRVYRSLNRKPQANAYDRCTVQDSIAADVANRGERKAEVTTAHVLTQQKSAIALSRMKGQRAIYVRNILKFRLPFRYLLVEPCDLLGIDMHAIDPTIAAGAQTRIVRVMDVEMDPEGDGEISIVAEEWTLGVAHAIPTLTEVPDGAQAIILTNGSEPEATGDAGLTRSNFDNLWGNPTSEVSPPLGADASSPEWAWRVNVGAAAYAGDYVRQNINTSGSDQGLGVSVACSPGESFYIEARAKSTGANASVNLVFYDKAGTNLGAAVTGTLSTDQGTVWALIYASATAPAGAVRCVGQIVNSTGTTSVWDAIYFRRMISDVLIPAAFPVTGRMFRRYDTSLGGRYLSGIWNAQNCSGTISYNVGGTVRIDITSAPIIPAGKTVRVPTVQCTRVYGSTGIDFAQAPPAQFQDAGLNGATSLASDGSYIDLALYNSSTGVAIDALTVTWCFDFSIAWGFA